MNMRIFSLILILGLFLFGIMGLFMFNSMDGVASHFCPISVLSENGCLSMDNGLAVALHHLSGWQKMFEAVLVFGNGLILAFTALLLISIFSKNEGLYSTKIKFSNYFRQLFHKHFSKFNLQFLRWLALQNKKDYSSPIWAYDLSNRF